MKDSSQNKYVYVVFSATPYKVGKFIRYVSRARYNHISISMDPDLDFMFSFARRYKNNPWYGGLVEESMCRYQFKKTDSKIMVCAIPVSEQKAKLLRARLKYYSDHKDDYIYNLPSLAAAGFGKRVYIRNSYTCIEFVCHVLRSAGIYRCKRGYTKIDTLASELRRFSIYEGVSSDYRIGTDWGNDCFTTHLSYPQRVANVTGTFRRLAERYVAAKGVRVLKTNKSNKTNKT